MADFNRRTLLAGAVAFVAMVAARNGMTPAEMTDALIEKKAGCAGFCALPNGVMMQWGVAMPGDISFPIGFETSVFVAVVEPLFVRPNVLLVHRLGLFGMTVECPDTALADMPEFAYCAIGAGREPVDPVERMRELLS
jgi:hypothetical protein